MVFGFALFVFGYALFYWGYHKGPWSNKHYSLWALLGFGTLFGQPLTPGKPFTWGQQQAGNLPAAPPTSPSLPGGKTAPKGQKAPYVKPPCKGCPTNPKEGDSCTCGSGGGVFGTGGKGMYIYTFQQGRWTRLQVQG